MTGAQFPSTSSEAARRIDSIGNYKLTGSVLGKGHFARVEEAIHMLLNVKVAIKIFDLQRMTDKYMQQHLRREAVILAKLSHPNVIALYEVHETDTHYFLVEEIGEGGNLSQFVRSHKNRRLDEKRSRQFCRQLISALAHLHRRGVIHRDLKMENILLDKTKEIVKLADFGLSNTWTPNCFLATHCGSPEYAAPELFVYNKRYGPEIDIWSLGVVFYAMVMGKLPFSAPKRANETNDENRIRLVAELKVGLAQRHKNEMLVCNVYFKSMISKMLVPAAKDRILITHLLAFVDHPKALPPVNEFPDPEDIWRQMTMEKISYEMNIPLNELHAKLLTSPHSSLGGIYNIRRHSHLLRQLNMNPLSRHVSFRAVASSPPVSRSNLAAPETAAVECDVCHTPRSSTSRPRNAERRGGHAKRDSPFRLHLPTSTTEKPAASARHQPSALRKPLERRCKTATTHAEALGKLQQCYQPSAHKPPPPSSCSRPSAVNEAQYRALAALKSPMMAAGSVLHHRRSVPIAKRYASDRTAAYMRPAASAPERPRTTGGATTSINNDQFSLRPCTVDCSDVKNRRLACGVPTHTAARAALRLAKASCMPDNDHKTVESRRAKLRAQVRHTIGTLSRSFSKFIYPSKRGKVDAGECENTETLGYNTRKKNVEPTKDSEKEKPTSATIKKRIHSPKNVLLAKRTSTLAFWRRTKAA